MKRTLEYRLIGTSGRLERIRLNLEKLHPEARLRERQMLLYDLNDRLSGLMLMKMTDRNIRLKLLSERLNAGSPLKKLTGGFGYISKDGRALKSVSSVKTKDRLRIVLSDGSIDAEVL